MISADFQIETKSCNIPHDNPLPDRASFLLVLRCECSFLSFVGVEACTADRILICVRYFIRCQTVADTRTGHRVNQFVHALQFFRYWRRCMLAIKAVFVLQLFKLVCAVRLEQGEVLPEF